MKRLIEDALLDWKKSSKRKPLLLGGARQVGKTYTLLDFGKKHYENVIYLHFEGDIETLGKIFAPDLNPKRIVRLYKTNHISGKNIDHFRRNSSF